MNIDPIVLSIPIYFVLIGAELLIQQFSRAKYYRLHDAITNISCGITQQITGVFFKIFSIGIYHIIYTYARIWDIPGNWATWIILFIAVDFCYYWAHRMSHEINLLWGGHVVHHQSEDYNLSVALRQSSLQVIWTFSFYLPLAVIGFNTLDFALMSALTTLYQFWIHTETIGKMGAFEWMFNTPSHHRVHHGRDPKYIDRNHAGVFIVWDKMFGTFQAEEEKPTYGITKPVNSWNPVWANVEHYHFMWQQLRTIRRWTDKIRYLIKKPGWMPEDQGGYTPAPHVEKSTYRKFETTNIYRVNWYVLYQYLLALAATSFFLFNQDQYSTVEKSVIAGLIILTITYCGLLFENKKWVVHAEQIRITIVSGLILFQSYQTNWDFIWLFLSVFYFVLSIIWVSSLLISKHGKTVIAD